MNYINPTTLPELYASYRLLRPLSSLYPDFSTWFFDKVVPGVINGNDKVILLEKKNEIVGISIIKKSEEEKKLRCLRIGDKFQKTGLGLYLIDESLRQLDCDKPIVSVAEEMINEYSRIFVNRYNFSLTQVYKGIYRKNKLEYEFNGFNNLNEKSVYF